jgi:hypothetical protein
MSDINSLFDEIEKSGNEDLLIKEVKETPPASEPKTSNSKAPEFDIPDFITEPLGSEPAPLNEVMLDSQKMEDIQKNITLSELIKPEMAVTLLDVMLPAIIVFIADKVGKQLNQSDFKLDKDEKKTVEKALNESFKTVNVGTANPFITLAIVLSAIYGAKFFTAAQSQPQTPPTPPPTVSKPKPMANQPKKDGRGRPKKIK